MNGMAPGDVVGSRAGDSVRLVGVTAICFPSRRAGQLATDRVLLLPDGSDFPSEPDGRLRRRYNEKQGKRHQIGLGGAYVNDPKLMFVRPKCPSRWLAHHRLDFRTLSNEPDRTDLVQVSSCSLDQH